MVISPKVKTILTVFIFLLAISCPYAVAWQAAGKGFVFGGFLFNPQDGNTYLAKMYQGWQGEWQFYLPYTSEPGEGAPLFLFYLFLGHAARIIGLTLPLVFHLARLLAAAVLLISLWKFLCRTGLDPRFQTAAFFLILLGSGMGWAVFPFGAFTSDFWVAEAYPFLSAFATPHFALGLAVMLWILQSSKHGEKGQVFESPGKGFVRGAVGGVILSIAAPFGVVVAAVVLGGFLAWEAAMQSRDGARGWRWGAWQTIKTGQAGRLFGLLLAGGWGLGYTLWITRSHPVLAGWNAQNLTPSPALGDLLISFSPLLLPAALGGWSVLRGKWPQARLLLVWLILGGALMYLPFGLQRRFMMGLYIPVAALAGLGFMELVEKWPRWGGRAFRLFAALALPTNLVILLATFNGVQTNSPLLYLSSGEAQALEWIEANTPDRALILTSPEMGLFLPAYTGRRVLYGHPFETVNAAAEKEAVTNFFSSEPGPGDEDLLRSRGVDYILAGRREAVLGWREPPAGLKAVYQRDRVAIYVVPLEIGERRTGE